MESRFITSWMSSGLGTTASQSSDFILYLMSIVFILSGIFLSLGQMSNGVARNKKSISVFTVGIFLIIVGNSSIFNSLFS